MKKLVVLTGAGISAESGLKTFRDSDGLWNGYNVEDVATPRAWQKDKQLVLDFYNMRRRDVAAAKPNAAHIGLAELQNNFDVQIITQNIDDLHERAGSLNVMHLHGEIFKMCCERNKNEVREIKADINLGDKSLGGFQMRPAIVWFEEPVPLIAEAIDMVNDADIFVIIGTSLAVYPAAGLIKYAEPQIPKFIIDKQVPITTGVDNLIAIPKPATEGIVELQRNLKQYI